jgi:hypothetical protein
MYLRTYVCMYVCMCIMYVYVFVCIYYVGVFAFCLFVCRYVPTTKALTKVQFMATTKLLHVSVQFMATTKLHHVSEPGAILSEFFRSKQ